MSYKSKNFDEEPLATRTGPPLPRAHLWDGNEGTSLWPQKKKARPEPQESEGVSGQLDEEGAFVTSRPNPSSRQISKQSLKGWPTLKRGHALSFAGLLLFTAVTYFRPYELIPALSSFTSMAFWLAVLTLVVFIPTQLSVEGNLTYRPKEV